MDEIFEEKEYSFLEQNADNNFSLSPLLYDSYKCNYPNYLNNNYLNSPYHYNISEDNNNNFDLIKSLKKDTNEEKIKNEKNEKKIQNLNEIKIKKNENNNHNNNNNSNKEKEEVFVMINNISDLDLGKVTQLSSYGCSNLSSNNEQKLKKIKKNIKFFLVKKTEKKIDPEYLYKNEENKPQNDIFGKVQNSIILNNNLPNYEFNDNISKNKYIKEKSFLKHKRKKENNNTYNTNITEINKGKNNKFHNFNNNTNSVKIYSIKNNIFLKEKYKNLKINIPKNTNTLYLNNLYNYPQNHQQIQIPPINKFNGFDNNINIPTEIVNHNICNEYNLDLLNSKNKEKERKNIYSYTPQIFESHAPPIKINGIEYTTILVPKQYADKIKYSII